MARSRSPIAIENTTIERGRCASLDAVEFLRRFFLHVLPSGFPKVRHYGLLANRSKKLECCRELFSCSARDPAQHPDPPGSACEEARAEAPICCKVCGSPPLVRREFAPKRGIGNAVPAGIDSS